MAEETKQYISSIQGYLIKDIEAQKMARNAATAAATAKQAADNALEKADAAYALAQSKDRALVYDYFYYMADDLMHIQERDYDQTFRVGTNLLIKEINCPDYWVTALENRFDSYSINDSESSDFDQQEYDHFLAEGWKPITIDFSDEPAIEAWYRGKADDSDRYPEYFIGRAYLSILETDKIDIDNYVSIDALEDELRAYDTQLTTKLRSGDIKVGLAASADDAVQAQSARYADFAGSADHASRANQDEEGNMITTHYATKQELKDYITIRVTGEDMDILKNGVEIKPEEVVG